jgi:phosphohistidine swiveling domain-containing protein
LIEQTAEADLLEALNQSTCKEFFGEVQEYLDRFGFRCMNEMKLEETDLFSDPSFFFACLKNYLRSGTTDLAAFDRRRVELRQRAEALVDQRLSGWRQRVFRWSMKHARRAVRNRENTRFARTRAYGVARSMFQAMGEDLCGAGILDRPRDIFYLEMDEISGLHLGTLTAYDLKPVVELRKQAYATFADAEPKTRFQTRGPTYWHNKFLAEAETPDRPADGAGDLRGLPCCPGVVEGVVKVVNAPGDNLELNGEILVALRTDPGWVPLYPSVSGLLVERGSLLSHSAIVAREMGLPTIVAVRGLTATLLSGMRVRMDGQAGTVKILEGGAPATPLTERR